MAGPAHASPVQGTNSEPLAMRPGDADRWIAKHAVSPSRDTTDDEQLRRTLEEPFSTISGRRMKSK